jgi:hypothetical protein
MKKKQQQLCGKQRATTGLQTNKKHDDLTIVSFVVSSPFRTDDIT